MPQRTAAKKTAVKKTATKKTAVKKTKSSSPKTWVRNDGLPTRNHYNDVIQTSTNSWDLYKVETKDIPGNFFGGEQFSDEFGKTRAERKRLMGITEAFM